ncbi:hypothetical protein CA85_18150 [Allorhodopirellula solitaria]|uniref:Uncharacterized protein n=1 Tax=Allorhodopirellula solitaria TaxID=2527987 RepID=A0A5C5YCB0_9BACT|nr:hypothetical protein CA85_18150 [Allorhodopirellula solitaria]
MSLLQSIAAGMESVEFSEDWLLRPTGNKGSSTDTQAMKAVRTIGKIIGHLSDASQDLPVTTKFKLRRMTSLHARLALVGRVTIG